MIKNIVPTLVAQSPGAVELQVDLLLGCHAFYYHDVSHSPARMGRNRRESQDKAIFPWGGPHKEIMGDEAGTDGVRPWQIIPRPAWVA